MDDKKLTAALNATGKECFVSYFKYFKDSSLSNDEIARMIERDRGYTYNSCNSRTSKARTIIKNSRAKDALQIIVDADRVDIQCRINAQKLIDGLEVNIPKAILRKNTYKKTTGTKNNNTTRQKNMFVKFQDLSKTVEKELTIILGKITHHIHPEVVDYITKSNIIFEPKFKAMCHKLCNVESFFYKGSDCVFPGFRRPINKEKNGRWKNNVFEQDGTILNDNTFPRHIWAYLSTNKAYSGGSAGMWSSSGLDNFELAHVFGHKQDERELESKVFKSFVNTTEPYGLFTSASNIVLIPKGFAKPTDHMKSVKICFYKRHFDLYGNNVIGLSDLDESLVPSWYTEIKWHEPILPDDWRRKIDNLLEYRGKYLQKKFSAYLQQPDVIT